LALRGEEDRKQKASRQIHRPTPTGSKRRPMKRLRRAAVDAREALKALIVANEFLDSEVRELTQAVSHAYVRGRFKTYTG
jgi:Spy/CpxP family protein refolding chaperone